MKAILDAFVGLLDAIPAARDIEVRRFSGSRSTEIVFVCRADLDVIALAQSLGLDTPKTIEFGQARWLEVAATAHGHVVRVTGPHHHIAPAISPVIDEAIADARKAVSA